MLPPVEETEGILAIHFSPALFLPSLQPPSSGHQILTVCKILTEPITHCSLILHHPSSYHWEPLFLLPPAPITLLCLPFQPFHLIWPYQPHLCISLSSSREWPCDDALGITPSQEVF